MWFLCKGTVLTKGWLRRGALISPCSPKSKDIKALNKKIHSIGLENVFLFLVIKESIFKHVHKLLKSNAIFLTCQKVHPYKKTKQI